MKLFSFFKNDLWKIIPNKEKPIKSFFIKIIRVIYFSIRSFYKDECYLKSALLTFYSLIAIVPFLALAMAIAKGFGFEIFLQEQILQTFKEQKDILNIAIHFAYSLITHIKSEVVAGLGVIFLFFSIFGLLENTEKSLNEIWKIKRKRSYLRKVIDYLAILIVCPIVFTASSSLTIFLSTHLDKTLQAFPILQDIYSYFISFFKILPFILSWLLFSLLYLFTPNTRIRFKPRLFAGFLAGTLFQLWQIGYIEFQLSISSYNAVYGSFAALPLFLIWLQ
ncbi:MAG: YihY/virulence factor BrkB family protein, partial [Anaerolineae bacterium]